MKIFSYTERLGFHPQDNNIDYKAGPFNIQLDALNSIIEITYTLQWKHLIEPFIKIFKNTINLDYVQISYETLQITINNINEKQLINYLTSTIVFDN